MDRQPMRIAAAAALLAPLLLAQDAERLFVAEPFTAEGSFTEHIEGPACDAEGNVYAVSFARQPTIGIVTPEGRGSVFVELTGGSLANGIRFGPDGMMYAADYTNHNILRIDPRTRRVEVFAHDDRMNQPNDLAVTPDGVLYASDPDWKAGTGQIWRIGRDGSCTRVAEGMGTTNGIEVSPDGRTLYVNESVQRNVWAFTIEEDGSLSNKRLLIRFPDHGMDGMRCDIDGNLYITRYGKGTVVKLTPEGEVIREIDVLGARPSNLAFGGPDGRTCYVTEVEHRRLVRFRVDRAGLAWWRWQEVRAARAKYDLVLKGGRLIDPRNGIDAQRDIAVAGGKIALVAEDIPASEAKTAVDLDGLIVTPGLIDIHVHVYAGTGLKALTGDNSVYPDGFSFRTGVTTMVDAGTAGWRNFPDFRQRVIDRAKTRVLAFLNICGVGMAPKGENDPNDMDAEAAAATARRHRDIIVGFKAAHYAEDDWLDIDRAVQAGEMTGLPVMVDFGYIGPHRTLATLLGEKLRPGDIYTHCYSGHRLELLPSGKLNPAMFTGRRRGVLFDVGHGGGSFYWKVAVPAFAQDFPPDTISTDLHTGSMNAGMKDLPNVMSKVLNLGVPLGRVIEMTTWSAARAIHHEELGHLSPGAVADITVLRVEEGDFGFLDAAGARNKGKKRLGVEMTIRAGKVVWDLNGRAGLDWRSFYYKPRRPPQRKRTAAAP